MAFFDKWENFNDNIAIIEENGIELTYKKLATEADRMYESVRSRSLAFIFCENTAGSVASYVGALRKKVCPLLLDARMDSELRNQLIHIYQPEYLFVPETMPIDSNYGKEINQVMNYRIVQRQQEISQTEELFSELALLLTTSGSTGSPKLVRQSYRNIQANAESIAGYLSLNCEERPITTLPMNYTYGLSIINSHLLVGATILMTQKDILQRDFWEFFRTKQATSFGGVPYTYQMLKRLHLFRMELPSLHTMTQAGGKLSPELHQEFAEYAQKNGKQFIVMYGQTEATARMAYLPASKALEKYGSMGIAIPGGHLELMDVNGQLIETPDTVGELVYTGENVTLGYAECREDLAKGDERQGRLVTGDMARRDTEGFYTIVGRKKRFLKMMGKRVNLDELERLLQARYPDADFACSGVDDKLYVFTTAWSQEQEKNIHHYLLETCQIAMSAVKCKQVEQIPKNEAGKTLYKAFDEWMKE